MVIAPQLMVIPVIPMVIAMIQAVILPAPLVIHENFTPVGGNYHTILGHITPVDGNYHTIHGHCTELYGNYHIGHGNCTSIDW